MVRKTRAHRTSSPSSTPSFDSERFLSEKNQEMYEKLNILRNVWVERKVVLDEIDSEIRRNFECTGWLPLLDVDHPPPATLIREFYSNLSIHPNDSNTQYVKSWIQGEEYTITPTVVASALGLPKVQHPVYPYNESPPLDDIMLYLTGSSIQCGSDPVTLYTHTYTLSHPLCRLFCFEFINYYYKLSHQLIIWCLNLFVL